MQSLFASLAACLDADTAIEREARAALMRDADRAFGAFDPKPLAEVFATQMQAPEAHPVCRQILQTPLPWDVPLTSADPAYLAVGHAKAHVELLGPGGLVPADDVRIGLYGMIPNAEYGLRTHPAEEVFVMLAGEAFWMRGEAGYAAARAGERSFHPSLLPHATKTGDRAFMSLYVWRGDIATDNYVYRGVPG